MTHILPGEVTPHFIKVSVGGHPDYGGQHGWGLGGGLGGGGGGAVNVLLRTLVVVVLVG